MTNPTKSEIDRFEKWRRESRELDDYESIEGVRCGLCGVIAEKLLWVRRGLVYPDAQEFQCVCHINDWNPSARIDHADIARRALPEDKRHKFVLAMDKIIAKETVGLADRDHAYFDLRWNAYNATPDQISRALYEVCKDD